jgi:hypothetical protein
VHRAVYALAHRDGLFEHVERFRESSFVIEGAAQHRQVRRGLVMVVAVPTARDLERLTVIALGLLVSASLVLHRADVDQVARHERMTIAVQLLVDLERAAVQRVGDVEVAGVEMDARQLVDRGRKIRTAGRDCRLQTHGLLQDRNRLTIAEASDTADFRPWIRLWAPNGAVLGDVAGLTGGDQQRDCAGDGHLSDSRGQLRQLLRWNGNLSVGCDTLKRPNALVRTKRAPIVTSQV